MRERRTNLLWALEYLLIVWLVVDKDALLVGCAVGSNEEFAAVVANESFSLLWGHCTAENLCQKLYY